MGFNLKDFGIGSILGGGIGGPIAGFWGDLNKRNSGGPVSPGTPITAENTKLINPLKNTYQGYNQTAQGSLADALGTIGNQAKTSAIASGRVQGSYQPQALARAGTMASRGIEDTLGGTLGNASLQEAKAQQEFERQMALAREIGSINKPSTLQEVIGGLSGAAGTIGQGASLYQALGKGGSGGGGGYSNNPSLGLASNPYGYDPSRLAGYNPYDYQKYWGGY